MGLYLLLLILLVKIEPPVAKSGENVAVIVDCVWPMHELDGGRAFQWQSNYG